MTTHREPIPAPFPVGARLRYVGPPVAHVRVYCYLERYLQPGSVVVVDHVTDGERGGRMVPNALDEGYGPRMVESATRDGRSLVHFAALPGDKGHLVGGERVQVWNDVVTLDGKVIDRVQVEELVGAKRVLAIGEGERDLWEVAP